MSRYRRKDPIGGWHHITNHAVGKEDLFVTDTDRNEFVRRMVEAATKHDVTIVAFCLMGNHFHLVLWCPNAGVSAFMHYLESIYAREFNMRHARRGALFRCEFYNKIIETEGQALATVRYVHRNPLELSIDIRTYPWSSYLAYVDNQNELWTPTVGKFSNLLGSAKEHRRYVETDFDHDEQRMSHGTRHVYRRPPTSVEQSLIVLCRVAATSCAVSIDEILAPRSRARNDARLAVSLIACESSTGSAGDVSRLLGYSTTAAMHSAVWRARARVAKDPQFRQLVFDLRSAWDPDLHAVAS